MNDTKDTASVVPFPPKMILVDPEHLIGIYRIWGSLDGILWMLRRPTSEDYSAIRDVLRPVMDEFNRIIEDLPVPREE